MTTNTTRLTDVHQQVTDQIVSAIEKGAGDYMMPWHCKGIAQNRPTNILTGNRYRGVNVLALWVAALQYGFSSGTWGTYRQWQAKGAQVRKGEKAALIVFYKPMERNEIDTETGTLESSRYMFARASWVFNADQVDGWTPPSSESVANPAQILESAERFVTTTKASVQHGGHMAYYRPASDHIQMPERSTFTGTATSSATESYYSVLLHELTHWTGAKDRLDRGLDGRFGSNAYAMEELVAELGAAFLCADLGITLTPRPDHAAYLANWLEVLKGDKRAIFTAAAKAAQAADYLAGLQPAAEQAAA